MNNIIKTILIILSLSFLAHPTQAQTYSTTQNYILKQQTRVAGLLTESALTGKPVEQVFNMIDYFDGFGRPSQTVLQQGTSQKKDFYKFYT